ncbi:mitochondrial 37S ribosomal protein rsm10 [Clydaea vesicula]|uniref:Mitochondrial 37S ribosomal protein rsm10 n=1 Tax=Clydaea vesicula TaxID=447962 RepID=A0AAD5XVA6_9FUNG|nr:mitochondrial 37S ribosomal protein rsm10 [Clydaea vesicula]KAJ3386649.1 mitochondrial 37S ribosomal protein rsm10 [Lobulomyces angularis]
MTTRNHIINYIKKHFHTTSKINREQPYSWSNFNLNNNEQIFKIKKLDPLSVKEDSKLCLNLEIRSFLPDTLDFFTYFARYSATAMSIPTLPVIHLETELKKWWVIKGPFVHAKSKEVFERKVHRRLIQVFDTDHVLMKEYINYINENLPSGTNLFVEKFLYEDLNISHQLKSKLNLKEKQQAEELEGLDASLVKVAEKEKPFDMLVRERSQFFLDHLMKQVNAEKKL